MTQIYTVHVHCAMLTRRDSPRLFGEPLDPTPGRPSQVRLLDCFRYDFYLAFALGLSEIGSYTLRCVVRVCCAGWLVRALALEVSLTSKFVLCCSSNNQLCSCIIFCFVSLSLCYNPLPAPSLFCLFSRVKRAFVRRPPPPISPLC